MGVKKLYLPVSIGLWILIHHETYSNHHATHVQPIHGTSVVYEEEIGNL